MRFTTPRLVKHRGTLTEDGTEPLFRFHRDAGTSDDPAAVSVWDVFWNINKGSRVSFTAPLPFLAAPEPIHRPMTEVGYGVQMFK